MSMDGGPWQPGDDTTEPDVEWALFGAHDIEYWVVRDGRLVPADGGELERIAERERERLALPRLRHWEREQVPAPARWHSAVARFVWWCRELGVRAIRPHIVRPQVAESSGDEPSRRRSDVARR